MNIKNLRRISLALLSGLALLGATGCELGRDRDHQDDDGYTRWSPPPRWPDHDHDRDRGHDHDHDHERERDHDRGGDRDRGGHEHERRGSAAVMAPDARAVTVLASLDGDAAGKLFDGRN
jgi:ABC-type Zn2+ transport system substrate-binding protein/surface adhesin